MVIMGRLQMVAMLTVLAVLPGLYSTAHAAGVLRNMTCDIDRGVNTVKRSLQSGNAVEADGSDVVLDPAAFYDLPQVAANFEFGEACLKAADWDHETCDIIQFLRQRELIAQSDLDQLQFYFEDRANRERDTQLRNEYWRKIKEVYACF